MGGMEKQSFELINGMKALAKVHSIVYDGTGSRFHFFRTLNRQILRKIESHPGISIIHYNDGLLAAFSLLHRGYGHIKRTATFHGLDVVFPSSFYQKLIIPKFNSFERIIAVSRATAQACIERGIQAAKVVVINNGVDDPLPSNLSREQLDKLLLERYGLNALNRKILICMGRAVKRKGFSWFIKEVMPAMPEDVFLLMVGPLSRQKRDPWYIRYTPRFVRQKLELFLGYPSDESHIDELIARPEFHKQIIRLGTLPENEVQALFVHSEAFIMPNIEVKGDMEGFGLVCLEAAICGAHVLASASGGIIDAIIHQKNGELIESGNAGAWIEKLLAILNRPADAKLTATDISDFTRSNFTWSKMCAGYAKEFQLLVSKNK